MDRCRIVLADDHQAILDRVSQLLAPAYDIVAMVLDGEAALDAVLVLKPDAVVLDISMPRMNGLEVASRLSHLPHPPRIVFLSVHEDPGFIDAARATGASGYVLKRGLHAHLAEVLGRALQSGSDEGDAWGGTRVSVP